eukprot:COSAG02_NODE_1649_length_11501_cov_3.588142_4_plen_141_part_00
MSVHSALPQQCKRTQCAELAEDGGAALRRTARTEEASLTLVRVYLPPACTTAAGCEIELSPPAELEEAATAAALVSKLLSNIPSTVWFWACTLHAAACSPARAPAAAAAHRPGARQGAPATIRSSNACTQVEIRKLTHLS